ncbi:2Fe-2S iron-sulfur cluster-binding protein [Marseilla massiliensis]|uniref:2Fe-2S iron-sulfur cluster-binding protein n=1 Tax=Marseilla massiliensis TaxID=1841864 RepID=UPI00374D4AE2
MELEGKGSLRRHGHGRPTACKQARCETCRIRLRNGTYDHAKRHALNDETACMATPGGCAWPARPFSRRSRSCGKRI